MALPIKGLQKTCLIDYQPYTASTVFLGGCNFKCGFCHNPDLVQNSIPNIDEKEIFDYLKSKKQWIDGVCITGGEPLLYPDIKEFASKLKEKGFLVKIDTNGTNPSLLKELIDAKLIDRVAMDIKTSKENYNKVANVNVDIEKIQESIDLIKNSEIEYEFRTTLIPGLVEKDEIIKIANWLNGAKKYVVQNFNNKTALLDKSFQEKEPLIKKDLDEIKLAVENKFEKFEIR